MSDPDEQASLAPAPVLYVTDLMFDDFDPADLFDLAFLLRSPEHELRAVCLAGGEDDRAQRVLDALIVRAGRDAPAVRGSLGFLEALAASPEAVNVVVVGGYSVVAEALAESRALFREKVARLFLVGGYGNDYRSRTAGGGERLPIDPRLKQRNPERFSALGDPRFAGRAGEIAAWATLLGSGEGVIWLPRDICLWRYAAPGVLESGGAVCEFLLRELFYANLKAAGASADRYDAADAPALLSSLPALLLALRPDPFVWMRLFRAIAARAEADASVGRLTEFDTTTDDPNLFAVVAIDGQALGKLLTARLRDRPLTIEFSGR